MTQNLAGYDAGYYQRDQEEFWFERHGLLRPDQLAALCYTLGWPFWGPPTRPRQAGVVVSMGAGGGFLEAVLEKMPGVTEVIGIDPSMGAAQLYRGSRLEPRCSPELAAQAGTVIFCESIEHIPLEETLAVAEAMRQGSRLVAVNWPDYHPLLPDGSGWDHITAIDDDLYDRLSAGRTVVIRRGSHLVLDAP